MLEVFKVVVIEVLEVIVLKILNGGLNLAILEVVKVVLEMSESW
jgi:hypothetical protein